MKKLFLIGLLAILLLISLASATDYYVSNSTGSDANTGSQAAPYATLSKIMSLANISSGDNFYFKRGDVWREWFNYTGTAGSSETSRVSFKAYGTGAKPRMYGSFNYSMLTWTNTSTLWTTGNQLLNNTVNMIWCNGVRGQNKSNAALLSSSCDFYYNTTSKNITVYYAGNLANAGIEIGQVDIPGLTNFWRNQVKAYLTFEDLEIGYCNNICFYNQLSTGVRFNNLTINHVWNNGLYINGDATNPLSIRNVVVENCTFYDTGLRGNILGGGGESVWVAAMRNTSVRNNSFLNPHGVVINFFKAIEGMVTNNSIRDCEQDQSDFNSGIYFDASNHTRSEWNFVKNCTVGMSVNAETASTVAVNNTFYRNVLDSNNVSIVINSNQNLITIFNTSISHNTIIKQNNGTGAYKYLMMMKFFNNLSFTDNLVQGIGDSVGQIVQLTNYTGLFTPDYNMYNQTAQSVVFEVNGTNRTTAQWQALGYDTNGVFNHPPKFVSLVGEVYTQYNDSEACDAGSSSSDIGAYDCIAGTSLGLPAPSSAQLLASNTTWLYFNWTVNNGTYYNRTTVLVNSVQVANYTTTTTVHNATGLTNGTSYLITLRNYDTYGNSNESNTTLGTNNLTWVNRTNPVNLIINQAGDTVFNQGLRNGDNITTSLQAMGQTFNISGNGNYVINSIQVTLNKTTTEAGKTAVINVYTWNGSQPTGNTLATTQTIASSDIPTNNARIWLNFTNPTTFTDGVTYIFIISYNGTSTGVVRTYYKNAATYNNGSAYWHQEGDPTTTWNYVGASNNDLDFQLFIGSGTSPGVSFENPTPTNNTGLISGTNYTITANATLQGPWGITNITIYNSTGSLVYYQSQNSTLSNFTFNINTTGTYYYNASSSNHLNYSTSENRQFTLSSASITILSPLTEQNVNNTLNITWQLNTTEIALNITSLNITINGLNITTIAGNTTRNYNWTNIYNYNLTTGLNNLTLNATITTGALITSTVQINITANTLVNISARNRLDNTIITNFNGWVYNYDTTENQTYTSTTGLSSINFTRGNTSVYINSTGYTINLSINNTANNVPSINITFFMDPTTIPVAFAPNVTQTCALNTTMLFTLKEEINMTNINGTVNYNLYFLINSSYNATHVYGTINNTNNFTVCVNSTLFPDWQINDGEIQYTTADYVTRRYYIFNNTRFSNTTTNITLYNIPDNVQTSFKLTIESNSLDSYDNKYTTLIRWYPGSNQYNVVDMGKTDTKGETVIHVEPEDVDYRIGVYELNGSLIYLANPIRMVCLTSPCTYTLKVPSENGDYTSFGQIQTLLTYNTTTGIWTLLFNDPTQTTDIMNLTIYKETGTSTYSICNSQTTGYTGAVTCNTSTYTGRLKGIATRSASPEIPINELIVEVITTTWNSNWGLFLSFLIVIPTILVFAFISPIAGIIGGVIALVPAWYLGSVSFAIIAGLAVLGGIVIHFAKRVTR